jgi:hypothetical protein
MPVDYQPKFQHVDWIDNVDRVQAAGENGFNRHFHDLEDEFELISNVVRDIGTALDALGGIVQAPVTLGFMPLMLPFNPDAPNSAWSQVYWSTRVLGQANGSFVKVPAANNGNADGVLPLTLPEGVKLQSLTVLGDAATPQSMSTTLVQELRVAPFTKTDLVVVPGFVSKDIPKSPVFSSDTSLFYLRATITGAVSSDVLRGFSIKYLPAS